jgi:hypothetical protein
VDLGTGAERKGFGQRVRQNKDKGRRLRQQTAVFAQRLSLHHAKPRQSRLPLLRQGGGEPQGRGDHRQVRHWVHGHLRHQQKGKTHLQVQGCWRGIGR